jgi:putative CocE/NonD family hydrolase
MVGPWDHEGSSEHTDHAIRMPLPPTGEHRWDSYQGFFDRYLMEIDNGFGKDGTVDFFTIAADRWQKSDSWPPEAMTAMPYYLRGDGVLSPEAPKAEEGPDRYRYDPSDPVAETVGLNCWALCAQLADRREIECRADVLCYTTAPLATDLELSGPVKAILAAASSAPDTDFTVTLVDLFPDGTANQIQDGIVRVSCRDDVFAPAPLKPGTVQDFEVDLFATSYLVKAGHRFRVDISSSCFDRYDRNPNTGDRFGHAGHTVFAEQVIHRSRAHPSRILLPIVR